MYELDGFGSLSAESMILDAQGANWMVGRKPGETERGIESIDLEARWIFFFSVCLFVLGGYSDRLIDLEARWIFR